MKNEQLALSKGYTVDDQGRVFNRLGHPIKVRSDGRGKAGYLYFSVYSKQEDKRKNCYVAKMVAYLKYGEALHEPKIQVRHKDGNQHNNRRENILIGTQSQNIMDIPPSVRMRSAMIASHKNLEYDWPAVVAHYRQSKSYNKTMKAFGIPSKGTMSNIIKRSKEGKMRSLDPALDLK